MADLPLWVVLALPFSGYLTAVATEYLRGHQALTREREARREAREAARQDARDAFERDTLIELQDAIAALMRNTSQIHLENEVEFRKSGSWGRRTLPEEIGGEPQGSRARNFERLRVRVLNDELRNLCEQWWSYAAKSMVPALREEGDQDARLRATADWERSTAIFSEVMEKVGSRLRELYTIWDQ